MPIPPPYQNFDALQPGEQTTEKYMLHYMGEYERIAEELGPAANVVELGVRFGASLNLWKQFFPKGIIVGVDISEHCKWPDGTVRIIASQQDLALQDKLVDISRHWDMISDDASHDAALSIASFNNLWPFVRPGGYYVIEDVFFQPRVLEIIADGQNRSSDIDYAHVQYGLLVIKKLAKPRWDSWVHLI